MRLGCIDGEAVLIRDDRYAGLAEPSAQRFATPGLVYGDWPGFLAWAAREPDLPWHRLDPKRLQAPVPVPGQVFGVGLNFHDHLAENGRAGTRPLPLTFTKFPSCITGPYDDVEIPLGGVDYEVELVLVIGRHADRVPADRAWDHIAGLTVGQDLSARGVQQGGQLSLAKSFRGFAPIGPWVTTPDELPDRDALDLRCWVNGELLQDGTTKDMVHNVPELIAFLSTVTPLRPGDLVFTGTPAGVGFFRTPQKFLAPADVVRSEIPGLGVIENRCIAPAAPGPYDQALGALAPRPPQPA
ncbi:fumarylacetoacetate hydrolase family protein [Peterkaempfera bronchialis]|uniref:Fumarylacetoacetate hydrolase family protein n=1 Tax=Peterkaempfera bronchialis TaxID=2126346 RepID=A0A345T3C6_9ACTN|nr:fumarylacetoacetate hydrolase family protein [Peterkaempfera bronchialis]AXI80481.1 fumarylacetoacetate hydrolase family protein [Peterkaempfera bronchialis]